jgi:hypothetical protein
MEITFGKNIFQNYTIKDAVVIKNIAINPK